MATGLKPFEGKNFAELTKNILSRQPNFKLLPADLRDILRLMFLKNPNERITLKQLLALPEIQATVR